METTTLSDDIRRYLMLMWHWAWLLILAIVLGGGAAFLISKNSTPVYQATTRLYINEAPMARSADYTSVLTSERLARTYSELLTTKPVLEEVIARLSLPIGVKELIDSVQVDLLTDTQLIDVSVEDTDPVRAADIANAIVTVFGEQNQALQASRYATSKESLSAQMAEVDTQIQASTAAYQELGDSSEDKIEKDRLETALAQYRQTYASLLQSYESIRLAETSTTSNVIQAEPATPPEDPIRPRTVVNTLLGAIAGFLLAGGIILLVDALDDTLSPDTVTRQLGLPVLGVIARHQNDDNAPVVKSNPRSPVAEAFRSLRTNIKFACVDIPLRTLLVTSPSPEDGKSTVAVNLGISLAQSGYNVALVEGDLRKPQIHLRLNLSNRQGISGIFVQPKILLNGALQKTDVEGLLALTSGVLPPNPSELLGSEKMFEILRLVGEQTDIIILDSPPVMAVTDAAVLAPRVDGVLLVVKPGSTKIAACRQAVEQLHRVGANILGVVLNDVEFKRSSYRYAYYRDYYNAYSKYYGHDLESSPAEEKV